MGDNAACEQSPDIREALSVIDSNDLCVLATSSADRPWCSLMAYVTSADRRTIYMVTLTGSRKFDNLTANTSVSLLIDTRQVCDREGTEGREAIRAVTVGGTCRTDADPMETDEALKRFREAHPHLKDFSLASDAAVLAVDIDSILLLRGAEDAVFKKNLRKCDFPLDG